MVPAARRPILPINHTETRADPILPHFPWKVFLLLWRCFQKIRVRGDGFRKEECFQYVPVVPGYFEKVKIRKKVQGNKPKNWRYYTSVVTATHKNGLKVLSSEMDPAEIRLIR